MLLDLFPLISNGWAIAVATQQCKWMQGDHSDGMPLVMYAGMCPDKAFTTKLTSEGSSWLYQNWWPHQPGATRDETAALLP